MMYNETVRECFFSPQHIGMLDLSNRFAVFVKNSQKGQGTIELYIQCTPDNTIIRACFKTNSNPYVIAGLEWLCRQLEGKSIATMPQIDYRLLIKKLDIPNAHYHIALRIIEMYQEIVYLMKKI